jgi:hypothetical protein
MGGNESSAGISPPTSHRPQLILEVFAMEPTFTPARAPWSTRPSLKAMAAEAGVDFDRFLTGLAANRSDTELAAEFGVDGGVIYRLRDHFERYGIHSIMGQD